jgi:hypothetical protein
MVDVELLYSQHLNAADRKLVRSVSPADIPMTTALGSPEVEEVVFPKDTSGGLSVGISPFLAFATAVHRTAAALESVSFVDERWGPRARIPVFDVDLLRGLLADPVNRYFFVELLTSYTRVTSGVAFTRTARGLRRHRFSELDPVRMAQLLDFVGETEYPGIYRRLGDLALFSVGVFPDHPPLLESGAASDRLLRVSGVRSDAVEGLGAMELFEMLGARWYKAAIRSAAPYGEPVTYGLSVVAHIADHFREARRVLNAVTDRYLFPWREQWFGRSAS